MASTSRRYSSEMRERAVRLVLESGRPIAVVAADLGVGTESLRTWVRRARADGGAAGGGLTSSERDELAGLRREVKDLRRANEILKAASVFFAGELDPRRSR
jgi:transposase